MDTKTALTLFLSQHIPTTAASYASVLTPMADFIGNARPIEAITPADLLLWADHLKTRDYAPKTLHKHISTAKIFFNWAAKFELIPRSPAAHLKKPNVPRAIGRDKAMTDEELCKILDFAKWKPRDHALILFLADTGARRSGAARLTVGDLDIIARRAFVTEKGEKTRPVAFGMETAVALNRWLSIREGDLGEYVWHKRGLPMQPENISRIIRRACEKAGVRSLGAHSLRHRKGHQFADERIAPSIAATALGHSDVTITLQHYYPSDTQSAEEALKTLSFGRGQKPTAPIPLNRKKHG